MFMEDSGIGTFQDSVYFSELVLEPPLDFLILDSFTLIELDCSSTLPELVLVIAFESFELESLELDIL